MKKILFIVLIAIISCTLVEKYESEEDLDIVLGIDIKTMWNKVKNNVNQAKAFLKSIGLYDPMISALKTVGSAIAVGYCTSKGVPYPICTSIVGFLMSLIK